MAHAHGHSVEDYLEAIYFLVSPIGEYQPAEGSPANAARVAEMLGVSRAAVGEMLKRLGSDGLLKRDGGRELVFTDEGRARAEQVVRNHRIIERFLTDFLGYSAAGAHEHADDARRRLHGRHDRAHERAARLSRPLPARLADLARAGARRERRPAGAVGARRPATAARSCGSSSTTATCCTGTTTRASSRAPRSTVLDVQPAAGHLKVALGGGTAAVERVIAEKAARGLIVRVSAA